MKKQTKYTTHIIRRPNAIYAITRSACKWDRNGNALYDCVMIPNDSREAVVYTHVKCGWGIEGVAEIVERAEGGEK